ncbi:hypothetical protein [Dietzia natronolimnaea]|nr:hypothetical protein [Dietzia natronolimnaea]MBB1037377.1 hypothetical protein [Dietzia natronolimnaea]
MITLHFSDEESIQLSAFYIDIAEGGEAGARAESEIVTLLAGKLGEAI